MTPCRTLERLNISEFDKKNKKDQVNVKHFNEYIDQYKKELKTTDKTLIKEHILRQVYKEVVQLDERKNAVRYKANAKPPNLDEFLDDLQLKVSASPRKSTVKGGKLKKSKQDKSVKSKSPDKVKTTKFSMIQKQSNLD